MVGKMHRCRIFALVSLCLVAGVTQEVTGICQEVKQDKPAMSVDEAIRQLNAPAALDQEKAEEALALWGPDARAAVPAIVAILEQDLPFVRTGLLHVLVAIGPDAKEAVPVLMKTAGNQNFHARYLSCRALGRLGPAAKPAVGLLIKALRDNVTSVRRNAAEALGRLGPAVAPEAVKPLIDTIDDPLVPVREEAVRALGDFGDLAKPAIPALEAAAFSPQSRVQAQAALALWKLTKNAQPLLPVLKELLHGGNLEWEAAQVLGEMGPAAEPVVPDLIAALERGDESVQIFTAEALGRIGPAAKPALPALRKLLEHDEPELRELAAQVIKLIEAD